MGSAATRRKGVFPSRIAISTCWLGHVAPTRNFDCCVFVLSLVTPPRYSTGMSVLRFIAGVLTGIAAWTASALALWALALSWSGPSPRAQSKVRVDDWPAQSRVDGNSLSGAGAKRVALGRSTVLTCIGVCDDIWIDRGVKRIPVRVTDAHDRCVVCGLPRLERNGDVAVLRARSGELRGQMWVRP